jgi:chemotaxis protein histidine kinase CheA
MSDPGSDDARARLSALQERFVISLRERLDRLDALVHAARSGSTDGALVEALVAAHRLAGTAGSYGHVEAGEAAAALEAALLRISEGSPDPSAWDAALAALERARAARPA